MQILNLYNTNTAYRGVKYETNTPSSCEQRELVFLYRGKPYAKQVKVCK